MSNKKLLKEAFNIKNAELTAKDGHRYQVAYVDPNTSENTYTFKEIFPKYKAKYLSGLKAWGWYLGQNPENIYRNFIQPCLEELSTVEDNGAGTRVGQITNIIDDLLSEIRWGAIESVNLPNAKNISEALTQFKADLLNCVSSEDFIKRMEPIIKFQQSQGHQYSLRNSLLIMFQDPEATMVKSKTGWFKMNREVIDTSHPILMWRPDKEPITPQDRKRIQSEFLMAQGVKSLAELNPGQKEELRVQLNGGNLKQSEDGRSKFKVYYGFDVRFTKQMDGKEDLVGDNAGSKNLDWYDKSTDENEYYATLISAVKEVIVDSGIKLEYVPEGSLGGALGVATGDGIIKVAGKDINTINMLDTLIHEESHQYLHIRYIKKSGNDELAQFYVGTEKGRGYIEQQAEITAWVVMKYFNVATETSINYASNWGLSAKDAAKTFDTISDVASFLIKKIGEKINQENNIQQ